MSGSDLVGQQFEWNANVVNSAGKVCTRLFDGDEKPYSAGSIELRDAKVRTMTTVKSFTQCLFVCIGLEFYNF